MNKHLALGQCNTALPLRQLGDSRGFHLTTPPALFVSETKYYFVAQWELGFPLPPPLMRLDHKLRTWELERSSKRDLSQGVLLSFCPPVCALCLCRRQRLTAQAVALGQMGQRAMLTGASLRSLSLKTCGNATGSKIPQEGSVKFQGAQGSPYLSSLPSHIQWEPGLQVHTVA